MKKVSTNEIADMKIGLYRYVDCKSGVVSPIRRVFTDYMPACKDVIVELRSISGIDEDDKHKKQQAFKLANLPAATFSCLCGYGKANVVSRINLIVLDIDPGENEKLRDAEVLNNYKREIFKLPYVYAVLKSASGKGIFAVIPIENTDDESFLGYFKALEQEFIERFGLRLDSACKNVNRLRYLTYDEEPLIKENTEIEYYDKLWIEPVVEPERKPVEINFHSGDDLVNDSKFVYQTVTALLNAGLTADDYKKWLVQGFMLAAFGEMGRFLFDTLSMNSSNYSGQSDVNKQFNICLKRTTFKWEDAAVYYFGLAKDWFGRDWKNKVRNTVV